MFRRLFPTSLALAVSGGDAGVDSALAPPASSAAVPSALSSDVGRRPNGTRLKVARQATFSPTSESEFHNFVVDDLGIDQSVNLGETVEFTFAFDRPGTFLPICVPHEALGMVCTVTVQ